MFSRSFSGYDPIFLKAETDACRQKYGALEDAKTCAIEQELQQKDELEAQLVLLKSRLESARGSGSLIKKYKEYFGSSLLLKVRRETDEKIQELARDAKLYEDEINAHIDSVDTEIQGIKREVRSVLKVIEDILDIDVISESVMDNRSRELDDLISQYAEKAGTTPSAVSSVSLEDDALLLPTLFLNEDPGLSKQELARVALTELAAPAAPLVTAAPEIPAELPSPSEPSGISKFFGNSPTVLVAENDEDTAELLRNILEREGFQVKFAADGYQAVKFIHVGPAPELVILNMLLPYIDGLQLIKQIRRKKGWETIPVIGMTLNYNEQETNEIMETGASDCIKKPFNPTDLISRISRLGSSPELRGLKS